MEPEFWHARWQQNQLGFHQEQVHGYLERYLPLLALKPRDMVFVPLCGKSLDLLRLAETGAEVVGVELSAIAVQAFFQEHGIPAREHEENGFAVFTGGSLRLFVGDFFALAASHVQGVRAAYDRAALIALPPDLRSRYARRLSELLPVGAKVLLVTLDYTQPQMEGPPFSVPEHEVSTLFSTHFSLELLERRDVLPDHPHFRARGLRSLHESAYLLVRKGV